MHETPGMDPSTDPARERPEPPPAAKTGGRSRGPGITIALVAVVIAFCVGFFWQFYEATTVRATLEATEQELVIERLRVQLASAAIDAQVGDYESARQQMSSFYRQLNTQRQALPMALETTADEFLAMRDDVITGLSRANPEYAGVLFGMLDRFELAVPADPGPARTAPAAGTPPPEPSP